ncbi:hypothetical protein BELL_1034g00010 [Botrytis elliptica]|uniref:Uncharacterized protein n=1 Tax=Botrytis elliptica TaxID=278938 RepID=A0A4Z1ISU7_9HELO|nr:hypothetical protein BELL_1034g00010 [Botrytis elliptica]
MSPSSTCAIVEFTSSRFISTPKTLTGPGEYLTLGSEDSNYSNVSKTLESTSSTQYFLPKR